MFRKVLIANRGEIAVRIAQTLQEMGIQALAVHSDVDRDALHVACADECCAIPGDSPADTYLNIPALIAAARDHGADAVHPGYGFLSENAEFARACEMAGLVFIGPSAEVIERMGDKVVARETAAAAGVPIVPGWSGTAEAGPEVLAGAAAEIGYPVLLKAAAGGGGKGMRIVSTPAALAEAVAAAQREAAKAFGDARVFLEKYIARPRHVEVQIFGDSRGNLVHLFERECSIQRRHQKVIEESPSPALDPALRAALTDAALCAGRAIGYVNAGTVEFILDPAGRFYFLEVNTRLQVEHPVTELVTRHDLVRAQVLVAAGEPLPFCQAELRSEGHAFECRIYAEDSARQFLPATGTLAHYQAPAGVHIRVDSGVQAGSTISVHYDPLLAKLIVWGRDRAEALARLRWALARYLVLGVTTNIEFLQQVCAEPAFAAGDLHTHFLEEHDLLGRAAPALPDAALLIAALAAEGERGFLRSVDSRSAETVELGASPWSAGRGWRNT